VLACGGMSEKQLAVFSVSALGLVGVVLAAFGSLAGSSTSGMWASGPFLGK
jgi:hypothetical protein